MMCVMRMNDDAATQAIPSSIPETAHHVCLGVNMIVEEVTGRGPSSHIYVHAREV